MAQILSLRNIIELITPEPGGSDIMQLQIDDINVLLASAFEKSVIRGNSRSMFIRFL